MSGGLRCERCPRLLRKDATPQFTARCMAGLPGTRPPISSVRWRKLASSSRGLQEGFLENAAPRLRLSAANVVVASQRQPQVSNER